jgi:hypothetical protein
MKPALGTDLGTICKKGRDIMQFTEYFEKTRPSEAQPLPGHTCFDHPTVYCPACGCINPGLLAELNELGVPELERAMKLLKAAQRAQSERLLAEAKAFNRKTEAENERLGVFKQRPYRGSGQKKGTV